MSLISKIRNVFTRKKKWGASEGYDLWAGDYDNQPGNLMLDLDEIVFSDLLEQARVPGKIVADIGCGTGRHWEKILNRQPKKLVGYDVSQEMLDKLRQKYPSAEVYKMGENNLLSLEDRSVELVVSTLTIAHIENAAWVLKEWDRVLIPGGEVIITDYHPELLSRGAQRTFGYKGKVFVLRNFIHPVGTIRLHAEQLGWKEIRFIEKIIDESVRSYYEKKQAISIFEKFKGTPVIYGIHFKKQE